MCHLQRKSIWNEINKLIHEYLFACVFLGKSFTNLLTYFWTYTWNSYNWTVLIEALIDKHLAVTSTACTSSYTPIFIAIAHHHIYVLFTCMFRTPIKRTYEHDIMFCKEVRKRCTLCSLLRQKKRQCRMRTDMEFDCWKSESNWQAKF